jgi:hypothetical protein
MKAETRNTLIISVLLATAITLASLQAGGVAERPTTEEALVGQAGATAEEEEEEEETVGEILARRRAEQELAEKALLAELLVKARARGTVAESPRPRRSVKRFAWGAAADARGEAWNIPNEESEQATLTAFLRICLAEADGSPQDCVGIWQVMRNIRRRGCERGAVRRITECDESGETMLSVMRRAQPHIMAVKGYALRNERARWIRNLEVDCEVPEGWTAGEDRWDAQYGSRRCPYTVELGRYLLKGELPPPRPGHRLSWLPGRPITWGGDCSSGKAACDDRIACARGLARIAGTGTHNAFWRRPRTEEEVDPVCRALGYGDLVEAGGRGGQDGVGERDRDGQGS